MGDEMKSSEVLGKGYLLRFITVTILLAGKASAMWDPGLASVGL